MSHPCLPCFSGPPPPIFVFITRIFPPFPYWEVLTSWTSSLLKYWSLLNFADLLIFFWHKIFSPNEEFAKFASQVFSLLFALLLYEVLLNLFASARALLTYDPFFYVVVESFF